MKTFQVDLEIGKRIKKLYKLRKLTQVELADLMDVNPCTLASWVHGTSEPSATQVKMLADILRDTAAYILYGKDDDE